MPPKAPTPKPAGERGLYPRWSVRLEKWVWDATASVDGRQHQSRGHATKALARAARDQIAVDMRKGLIGNAPVRLTVGQLIEKHWLPATEAALRVESSKGTYRYWASRVVADLGTILLARLTKLDVVKWKAQLETDYAPSTARGIFSALRSAMRWAEEYEFVYRNVTLTTPRPKAESRNPPVLPMPTIQRLLELADAAEQPAGLMVWLGVMLGMRFGEIVSLSWDQIDLGLATIRLNRIDLTGGDKRRIKTRAGERPIKLSALTVERLRNHRLEQMRAFTERGAPPPTLVVLRADGKPVKTFWWWWRWNALREAIGLPEMHFHDLKHVNATLMARANVHPRVMQERLGHTDAALTLNIYTHVSAESQTDAAEAIERLFSEPLLPNP